MLVDGRPARGVFGDLVIGQNRIELFRIQIVKYDRVPGRFHSSLAVGQSHGENYRALVAEDEDVDFI